VLIVARWKLGFDENNQGITASTGSDPTIWIGQRDCAFDLVIRISEQSLSARQVRAAHMG
jgi:hypothetical protein